MSMHFPSQRKASVTAPPISSGSTATAAKPQASRKTITHEMIAKRAFEISRSPQAGSQTENWLRAERELLRHRELTTLGRGRVSQ